MLQQIWLFSHLRDIVGVNTVYRVSNVLGCRYDKGERKHACCGDAVVKTEHPAVNVHMRDVQKSLQLSKNLQHASSLPRITTHKLLQHCEMPQFPNRDTI